MKENLSFEKELLDLDLGDQVSKAIYLNEESWIKPEEEGANPLEEASYAKKELTGRFVSGQIWNEDHLALEILFHRKPMLRPAKLNIISNIERLQLLRSLAVRYKRELTPIREGIIRPIFGNPANFQIGSVEGCQIQDLRREVLKLGPLKGGEYKGKVYYKRVERASPREKAAIDSIVLHHMAYNIGNDVNSYIKVGAHYIVTSDGQIAQLYDDLDFLNASNGFNSRSVSIEFAGNFPDGRYRWWKESKKIIPDRCYLTPAQIRAGRCLLSTLKARLPGIKYLYAHRQSSSDRENDPGPDVWFNIAEWALVNLNLTDRMPRPYIGTGQAIPESWRKSRPAMPAMINTPTLPNKEAFIQQEEEAADWEGFESEQSHVLAAGVPKRVAAKPSAESVRFAQRVLNAAEGERLKDDGYLGRLTQAALERFRKRYSLGMNGVLDASTELALAQRALEELAQASMFSQLGRHDARTEQALIAFKSTHHLGMDARLDNATRQALTDALARMQLRPTSTTTYLGGKLWTFESKTLPMQVAVFCPKAALLKQEVEVIIYIHGLLDKCLRPKSIPDGIITDAPFKLGDIVTASGRPIVLVVPYLDWTRPGGERAFDRAHRKWHALGKPANLNGMITEALAELGRVQSIAAPSPINLIIAGHSRAYGILEPLAHSHIDPEMGRGALARLSQVWAFDTTYSTPDSDVNIWKSWLDSKPNLRISVFFRPGSGTAWVGDKFYRQRSDRLRVIPVSEGHCSVPTKRLPGLLKPPASSTGPEREVYELDRFGQSYEADVKQQYLYSKPELEALTFEALGSDDNHAIGESRELGNKDYANHLVEEGIHELKEETISEPRVHSVGEVVFPSGQSLRVVTGYPVGTGEEFWDPTGSGNPLLDTGPALKGKKLSADFTVRELTTSGGVSADVSRIDPKLVEGLQRLKDYLGGKPITITSGFRSWKRNKKVYDDRNKNKPPDKRTPVTLSQHCAGRAVDIKIKGMNGLEIGKAAIDSFGPNIGIGLAPDYAHIDIRGHAETWPYTEVKPEWVNEIRKYQQEKGGKRKPSQKAAQAPIDLVRFAQRVLNAAEGEKLAIDGGLGPLTRGALERFRRKYNLGAGGMLDDKTQLALAQKALEEIRQQSMFGQLGILDSATRRELIAFKSKHSLPANDSLDAATRAALANAIGQRASVPSTPRTVTTPSTLPRLGAGLQPPADPNAYRKFRLTTYYIVDQSELPTGAVRVPIYADNGHKIAEGSPAFFSKLSLEGTARLADGRLINVTGKTVPVSHDQYAEVLAYHRQAYAKSDKMRREEGRPPVPTTYSGIVVKNNQVVRAFGFHEVPESRRGVGYGILRGIPLVPFRTLAADIGVKEKHDKNWKGKGGLVPPGTHVFIKEFDGLLLPDGKKHDGWFIVNDTGGAIFGAHFDVFVGTRELGKRVKLPEFGQVWFDRIEQRIPSGYTYGLKA